MLRTKLTLSTLAATIVLAGCSTQMTQPVQKDASSTKVEAVKVEQNIVDLGNKDGASANVRFGFDSKSPFGIKAATVFDATNFANTAGGRVLIRLHRFAAPLSKTDAHNPSVRFDDTGLSFVGEYAMLKPGAAPFPTTFSLTFKGLKPSSDYLVSARAFVDMPLSGTDLEVNTLTSTGDITLTGGSIQDAKTLNLEPGDEIQLDDGTGAKFYKVINITDPDNFKIAYGGSGFTSTPTGATMFARNVTSLGDKGTDSTPINQGNGPATSKGGGTAGGDGVAAVEEMISVDATGSVVITNDVATANSVLDIKLQLRSTFTPAQSGSVEVLPGGVDSASEVITSP